jgi:hypothetical protein
MRCVAAVILILAFAGCKRDETKVYHIVQEESPQTQSMPAPPETPSPEIGLPQQQAVSPQLNYQLPEDWQEKPPSEMRVASFTALGANGQSADVSVIPLPIIGQDLELINMWRSQVQLPATSDPDAVKQAEPVAIGTEQGRLFDFVSEQPMIGNARQRILVAMLTRGSMSWFFKMTGEDSFVAAQKPAFIQFLKSVNFIANAASIPNLPTSGSSLGNQNLLVANPNTTVIGGINSSSGEKSIWTIPADWQQLPPSEFLVAKFSIIGADGAAAQVNVSSLAGEGGGFLANVNRWRGQLGLPQISETDLQPLTTSIDSANGKIQVVDFSGTDSKTGKSARLVGAVVPENGQTWFYKLMGDGQIVAQQKDAFIKFIQSAKYPDAGNAP